MELEAFFIKQAVNGITNRDNGRELLDIYETILTNNRVFRDK